MDCVAIANTPHINYETVKMINLLSESVCVLVQVDIRILDNIDICTVSLLNTKRNDKKWLSLSDTCILIKE